jgi:predicted Zn-dependent protease
MRRPLYRRPAYLAGAVLTLALASCGTLTVPEEKELGRQGETQVRREFALLRDRVIVNYIRDLGAELVKSSRPTPFEMRFFVIEDENINAFALPGGAVYVHSGLIQAVGDTDELVGVLAHEIGHVTERHVARMYKQQRNTAYAAQAAGAAAQILIGGVGGDLGAMATSIAAMAYSTSFTREFEAEADKVAVETMVKAGWDPNGMIRMFETLKRESGGGGMPKFLSSHPPTDDRIALAKAEIGRYSNLGKMRTSDGGKLDIIKRRLELVVGTESEADPSDEDDGEDSEDDE